MNLNFAEALHCSNIFYQYFGKFERIDDYMRDQKIQSLENLSSNPLFDVSDEIFSDFAMNPEDMDLDLVECNDNTWNTLLNITSSHINIPPVGRNLKMAIKEKITNKYVGFIRLSSPMINCSPRNKLLDSVFSQKPGRPYRSCNGCAEALHGLVKNASAMPGLTSSMRAGFQFGL